MTLEQCRAARALLGWSQIDLAAKATVSIGTIRNFEQGTSVPLKIHIAAIRRTLERAGVRFIDEPDHLGVALRTGRKPRATREDKE